MLVGTYTPKPDAKSRVVFPSKFRAELGASVVVTIGMEHSIAVYSREEWEVYLERVKQLSTFKKDARDFRRFILSKTYELDFDAAGRIIIPQDLKTYAGIDSQITLIGVENHVEVWNSEKWAEHETEIMAGLESMAEALENKN
ncbi:MAG: division/cell wall cluster transcriptional repressor MraZ [Synergistaceae bacterium]|nr:division/cell wall cluster transcriptional repressor MraZ [Synergistaceae bacterium]